MSSASIANLCDIGYHSLDKNHWSHNMSCAMCIHCYCSRKVGFFKERLQNIIKEHCNLPLYKWKKNLLKYVIKHNN